MNVALRWQSLPGLDDHAERLGRLAVLCLKLEVETFPKPGLVSHVDNGSHKDMDAELLCRSADSLTPFFRELAIAGVAGAGMNRLRAIGLAAESAMLDVTRGVNTHRGAIFGLGLLCAAAGYRAASWLPNGGATRSDRVRCLFAVMAPRPHGATVPAERGRRPQAVSGRPMRSPFPHCMQAASLRLMTRRPPAFRPAWL
jgi:hypothetical protein